MLEVVRFLLSAVVVEAHIWPLNVPWFAWEAVFAFYTLSGFLMTMTLHKKYGFTGPGLSAFCINRILRLWPAYLVILSITVAALYVAPLGEIYGLLRVPQTSGEWAANLALVGLVGSDFSHMASMPLTLPNNWSLSIEVVCCGLLMYFGKTPRRLLALAALGATGVTYSTITCGQEAFYGQYCFQNRYGVLQAGFHPVFDRRAGLFLSARNAETPWQIPDSSICYIRSCISPVVRLGRTIHDSAIYWVDRDGRSFSGLF